jgi:predicted XRE-type DNA-binding protein
MRTNFSNSARLPEVSIFCIASIIKQVRWEITTFSYEEYICVLHCFTRKINPSYSDIQTTIDLITERIKISENKIVESSGNVFADIGLQNAEEIFLKAQMSYKIDQEIKKRNLTQAKAAKLLEIPQPRISQIINGKFQDISELKLMHCLNKLGYNINIQIEALPHNAVGHISLAIA